ncbi:hypothetical protein [Stenotrophomonas tumulicola]|uniref:Uncharacterized protein n=1 Tax=Stenotrophomonas tumulicola TaxID=1685415 RepID=A0A7W3FQF9_9GAMM|nr:hypothetical protein [Stenotrophomonas tumulicola]MBA8683834.1 hypothetical protein [Stenotrophomonas tumulicola]
MNHPPHAGFLPDPPEQVIEYGLPLPDASGSSERWQRIRQQEGAARISSLASLHHVMRIAFFI